jgi:hypothetical protein
MAFEQMDSNVEVRETAQKTFKPDVTLNDIRALNGDQKNTKVDLPPLEITGAEKVQNWLAAKEHRSDKDNFDIIDENHDGRLQKDELDHAKSKTHGMSAVMLETLCSNYEDFRNANKADNAEQEFNDGITRGDINARSEQSVYNAEDNRGLANARSVAKEHFGELAGADQRISRDELKQQIESPTVNGNDLEGVKFMRDNFSGLAQSNIDSPKAIEIMAGRKYNQLSKDEQRSVRIAESEYGITEADMANSQKKLQSQQVGRYEEDNIKWTLDRDARIKEHEDEMQKANAIKKFLTVDEFAKLDRDGEATGHYCAKDLEEAVKERGRISKEELDNALGNNAFSDEEKQIIKLMKDNFDDLSTVSTVEKPKPGQTWKDVKQTISFTDAQNYADSLEKAYVYREINPR